VSPVRPGKAGRTVLLAPPRLFALRPCMIGYLLNPMVVNVVSRRGGTRVVRAHLGGLGGAVFAAVLFTGWGCGGSPGPSQSSGLLTGAITVSVNQNYACAVMMGGTVMCWGSNGFGQLGNGTSTSTGKPVVVTGLSSATAVSAGLSHVCAVLADHTAVCWGNGGQGELGTGANVTASNTPLAVPARPLGRVASASASGPASPAPAPAARSCRGSARAREGPPATSHRSRPTCDRVHSARACIGEQELERTLEYVPHRLPIHAGGLHRDVRASCVDQSLCKLHSPRVVVASDRTSC